MSATTTSGDPSGGLAGEMGPNAPIAPGPTLLAVLRALRGAPRTGLVEGRSLAGADGRLTFGTRISAGGVPLPIATSVLVVDAGRPKFSPPKPKLGMERASVHLDEPFSRDLADRVWRCTRELGWSSLRVTAAANFLTPWVSGDQWGRYLEALTADLGRRNHVVTVFRIISAAVLTDVHGLTPGQCATRLNRGPDDLRHDLRDGRELLGRLEVWPWVASDHLGALDREWWTMRQYREPLKDVVKAAHEGHIARAARLEQAWRTI